VTISAVESDLPLVFDTVIRKQKPESKVYLLTQQFALSNNNICSGMKT